MATLGVDIGFVTSRIKALALPGWAWNHPSWEEWCRTLETVASSIDPKGSLEYAAACARAWGGQVR